MGEIRADEATPYGQPIVSSSVPTRLAESAAFNSRIARLGESSLGAEQYRELDVQLDQTQKTFWCFLRPQGVPSFTHGILRELADMQRGIKRMFAEKLLPGDPPIRHFVIGSRLPGIFNTGGDLAFFADRIRARDRTALQTYARSCIEVVYNNATALDLPIVTIALVQGDALGGGFEAVLSCKIIVAEKSVKMGLPEILFNLFPGMGAYSLLARKLDPTRAERMILSGRVYAAAELHEMGLVDVLAEDGKGEDIVRHYIARNAKRHAVQRSVFEVCRRITPLSFSEFADVAEIWVDTALRLEEVDLRKMERLMSAQRRRLVITEAHAASSGLG